MKVYVITKGEYSDYCICTVTTDKDMAEKLRLEYSDIYDTARIEEFETDEHPNPIGEYHCFLVAFNRSLKLKYVNEYMTDKVPDNQTWYECGKHKTVVLGNDRDTAIKIARDRVAKYLSMQEGL